MFSLKSLRLMNISKGFYGTVSVRRMSQVAATHSFQQSYPDSTTNFVTQDILNNLSSFESIDGQRVGTLKPTLESDFKLQSGATLPKESIQMKFATFGNPDLGKPIILLCPSMSNSVFAMDSNIEGEQKGWWRRVIGKGEEFGIDINKFFVVCGAPLGSPFGSTSPLTLNPKTKKMWGPTFPQITPKDQAKMQKLLLQTLGIEKVYAVVGGSMGGMQAIQFVVNYPESYDTFVSIAATAQTSPGIVALRSVQRAAVMMDPEFKDGYYHEDDTIAYSKEFKGPIKGLRVARMFGTICYRSHDEFVERFDWYPMKSVAKNDPNDVDYTFEVESYLDHQADNFVSRSKYDANCYLLNSKSMDLMDIGGGEVSFDEATKKVPSNKKGMLLSYSTDRLTPAEDLERFSSTLGRHGVENHFEVISSKYGHDAFLIEREAGPLNLRLKSFLGGDSESSVDRVHRLTHEMYHA